jgi:predicted dehydrogenase
MLEAEDLEAVCICGPPQMHYEIGLDVVRRGLPIYVDKPSALDHARAFELAEAAREAGVWGITGFMKRFAPTYVKAKEIAESEEFGPVSMVAVRYTHGAYPLIWGLSPQAYCCLVGNSCHAFDLARYYGGHVAEIYAKLKDFQDGRFAFAITVAFEDGIVGLINVNGVDDRGWVIRESLAVSGAGACVEVEDLIHLKYRPPTPWTQLPGPPPIQGMYLDPHAVSFAWGGKQQGYEDELRHLAVCVRSGEQPRCSLYDGAASLAMAEAIWESAHSGKPVVPKPSKPLG